MPAPTHRFNAFRTTAPEIGHVRLLSFEGSPVACQWTGGKEPSEQVIAGLERAAEFLVEEPNAVSLQALGWTIERAREGERANAQGGFDREVVV